MEFKNVKDIQFAIVIFWFLFWLFSVIDKFIFKASFLWVGKDFFEEFVELFSSLGIGSILVVNIFYWFVVLLEILALLFLSLALFNFIFKNEKKLNRFFLLGTYFGLGIFTFFTLGDQIFGEREELLEHIIFWLAVLISWFVFIFLAKFKENKKDEDLKEIA